MGLLHDGILDSSITASSCLDAYSCVTRSRLNTMATKMYRGAWLPRVADENQWIQTFSGNFDTSTPVANEFSPPFVARFVRLEPQTWHNYIALRLEFYIKGPVADAIDTARPLGMMDGQIPDVFISSSSCHSKYFCTRHARLNYPSASWLANRNDYEQWIKADLRAVYIVQGVITQGQPNFDQWVTRFTISHSLDGKTWAKVKDHCTSETKTFVGNHDSRTPIVNFFDRDFKARLVRLEPKSWYGHISMRFEVMGKGPIAEHMFESMELGVEHRHARLYSMTASSCHDHRHCADHARLNQASWSAELRGAWMPKRDDRKQWVQVDLSHPYLITGIVTKGMQGTHKWVSSFLVSHSNNGRDYEPLRDKCCEEPEDFIANDDDSTQVTNTFHPPFTARYVRIYPVSWVERIALRFELLGVKLTNGEAMITRPLGLEDRRIADSQLSASSCWNTIQCANTARLFNEYQAWSPKKTDKNPWIQVDLRQSFRLEAVLTQGRDNADNWIQTFLVTYSLDGYSWTYSLGNDGQPQIFHSNQDRNSLVVNPFMPAFVARFVRIEPLSWHHHISLRFELFGAGPIPVIPNTLGLEDYRIADSELQASSCNNDRHCANHARLNFAGEDEQGGTPSNSVTSSGKLPGAWIPRYNDHNQWVGVDLVEKYRVVGVITQGREDADQWVTSFAVSYSMDNEAWSFIGDCDREEKIYRGNHDRSTPIINLFETPLLARSVRVHPKRWTRHIALRLELLGNGPVAV
ncbi:uncharacterized protein LOC580443 [Strongylocentrotus purpuratus]|uniref:F5/8 type C domain-containing protein n=1 Tax=Strongylocentrotus purpuratus TaxID=7668 RepID=A0A7M7NW64_STRPU|nr:uncharacterized protein LOC580443 [Strongylocentrotus purpuratus]